MNGKIYQNNLIDLLKFCRTHWQEFSLGHRIKIEKRIKIELKSFQKRKSKHDSYLT